MAWSDTPLDTPLNPNLLGRRGQTPKPCSTLPTAHFPHFPHFLPRDSFKSLFVLVRLGLLTKGAILCFLLPRRLRRARRGDGPQTSSGTSIGSGTKLQDTGCRNSSEAKMVAGVRDCDLLPLKLSVCTKLAKVRKANSDARRHSQPKLLITPCRMPASLASSTWICWISSSTSSSGSSSSSSQGGASRFGGLASISDRSASASSTGNLLGQSAISSSSSPPEEGSPPCRVTPSAKQAHLPCQAPSEGGGTRCACL